MVCVPCRGHVAVWRIKLAAVVYRLSLRSICSARPRRLQACSQAQLQTHPSHLHPPQPLTNPCPHVSHTHTEFWIVAIPTSSHDTIYSGQPLLPRVLCFSSMQISHVLIVVIYLFFLWKREKREGKCLLQKLIRCLSSRKRRDRRFVGQPVCTFETVGLNS